MVDGSKVVKPSELVVSLASSELTTPFSKCNHKSWLSQIEILDCFRMKADMPNNVPASSCPGSSVKSNQ